MEMKHVYGAKPLKKRDYGLPRSTECQRRVAVPVKDDPAADQLGEPSNGLTEVLVETEDGELSCPVRIKAGQKVTFLEDTRNLRRALVPEVNQPYQFYFENSGHLRAAHEIRRGVKSAKAISPGTVCPRVLAIHDKELFCSQKALDLSTMRGSTKKSKDAFMKQWNSSVEPFFVKCNKVAVDFVRKTVMEDPERDKKPGVYLLLEKDTRLYTYPPIRMCTTFTRVFVGADKSKETEVFFHAFIVEALQELYPGQRQEILNSFPFKNWGRVSEFVVFAIFGKALSSAGDTFPPVLSKHHAQILMDEARIIPVMQTGVDSRQVVELRNYETSTNLFMVQPQNHVVYMKFLQRLGVVKNVRRIFNLKHRETTDSTSQIHYVAQVTLPTVLLNVLQALMPKNQLMINDFGNVVAFRDNSRLFEESGDTMKKFVQVLRMNWTELKLAFAKVDELQKKFASVRPPKYLRTTNWRPDLDPSTEVFGCKNQPKDVLPFEIVAKQPYGVFPVTPRYSLEEQFSMILDRPRELPL